MILSYINDLLGRRTAIAKSGSMMAAEETQPYGYNVRDELISGQAKTYAYDDIGNRTIAEGKTYVANNLNQYTAIDDFVPEYDADGNQTLIKTETGVWSVVYNAENRPVRWESGDTVITMAFDRMGRRVEYHETRAGQVATHFRFVYDNFLCVQRLNVANGNAVRTEFVWDLTEPIATRPLVFQPASGETAYYFHDGNKNVSEVFYHALQDGIAAHYDYAPFGAVTRTARATRVTNLDLLSENPFRFSSEYYDVTSGLVYYNYRHYAPLDGRWTGRDLLQYAQKPQWLATSPSPYAMVSNLPTSRIDLVGVAYIAKRPLAGSSGRLTMNIPMVIGGGPLGGIMLNKVLGDINLGPWHEHIVYEDGKEPSNEGFFDDGRVKPDPLEEHLKCCEFWTRYDDALMREAVRNVSKDMEPYDLLSNNCQDFVDMAKEEYYRLREQQDEERKHRTVMPDFRFGPPSVPHLTTPVH